MKAEAKLGMLKNAGSKSDWGWQRDKLIDKMPTLVLIQNLFNISSKEDVTNIYTT